MLESHWLNQLKSKTPKDTDLTGTSSPDYHLHNADWTKNTWDLPKFKDAAEFKQYLKKRGQTVEQFKRLPVYNAANRPAWVKDL